MTRLIAPNFSYRITAVVCFAVGYLSFAYLQPESIAPVIVVKPKSAPENPTQSRDMAEYEFAGDLDRCESLPEYDEQGSLSSKENQLTQERQCSGVRIQAREILLKNWRAKVKTYTVVKYHGDHCPAPEHVFIEPDIKGRWRVVIRQHAYGVDPGFDGRTMVDRIAVDLRSIRPHRSDFRFENGRKILVFLDEQGNEVLSL